MGDFTATQRAALQDARRAGKDHLRLLQEAHLEASQWPPGGHERAYLECWLVERGLLEDSNHG